ncbi:MAG TPA: apolipoprotein N-acyltransferase [Abditibacteriaceae bacterium]
MSQAEIKNSFWKSPTFCAVATAVLLWLPVQKMGWFPLAWIGLAPLLWAAREMDAKARLRYGWRAGFGFYVLTNWWILPTIIYGSPMIGAPPALGALLGVIAVSFIAGVHGWQFAIALWLWDTKKWAGHLWLLPIIVALFWGFFDWLRCIPPLAHIWGALAFTQWNNLGLLQTAPLIGQHGITILVAWFGAGMALWAITRRKVYVVMPIIVFAGLPLAFGNSPVATGATALDNYFPAVLVSTNVPSLTKTGRQAGESNFEQALRLTRTDELEKPFLIVWPETTFEIWQVGNLIRPNSAQITEWNKLQAILKGSQAKVLSGIAVHQLDSLDEKLSNSAVLLGQNGKMQSAAKIRTVPMGERAPLGEYLPFLRRFAPNPEVTPGTTPKPLDFNGKPIGTLVCFESCFPEPARSLRRQGAQILFIITNDEYFKGTNAPWEHATMAVLRAAENQIPVAQVANGGYTLVINKRGRILYQSFGPGAASSAIPLY